MSTYRRVVPRDLFNEAKLLKCLGRIALLAEDGVLAGWSVEWREGDRFLVEQDPSSGDIHVEGLRLRKDRTKRRLHLSTSLNSREAWPLVWYDPDTEEEGECFLKDGALAPGFMELLGILSQFVGTTTMIEKPDEI